MIDMDALDSAHIDGLKWNRTALYNMINLNRILLLY